MKRTTIVPGEPVDIVIPVRTTAGEEYQKLDLCCKTLRAYVPVNRIIMVTADTSAKNIHAVEHLADTPIVDKSAVGVGRARGLGLNYVETSYYASIDADVILAKQWYSWSIVTIKQKGVGACQGYSRPLSRLYGKLQYLDALKAGRYIDLGNTMLSTKVVREVGMPEDPSFEDEGLRRRLAAHRYSWITNPSLISTHLLADSDIFRHTYHFGTLQPEGWLSSAKEMLWISRRYTREWKKYGLELSLYLLLLEAVKKGGSFISHYRRNIIYPDNEMQS